MVASPPSSGASKEASVERFESSAGRRVYRLPVEAFPGFEVNVFLISDGDRLTLVDCGSGTDESRRQVEAAVAEAAETFGEALSLDEVDSVLITHGHIDHFGGLGWVKEITGAPAAVHILDRRVLSNYEERVLVASKNVESFLHRAGVAHDHRGAMMEMYLYAKGRYRSTPVEIELKEGEDAPGRIGVVHVPGHCPGQVCLRVDDLLLTADHVLAGISPHQSPESITQWTGLGHYFESLAHVRQLEGIRLALGSHGPAMDDLAGRTREIEALHRRRLDQCLEACAEPCTTVEVSRAVFGRRRSYHVLLAVVETGAHLEYLYQRGEICAVNLEEIEREPEPVIRYRRC